MPAAPKYICSEKTVDVAKKADVLTRNLKNGKRVFQFRGYTVIVKAVNGDRTILVCPKEWWTTPVSNHSSSTSTTQSWQYGYSPAYLIGGENPTEEIGLTRAYPYTGYATRTKLNPYAGKAKAYHQPSSLKIPGTYYWDGPLDPLLGVYRKVRWNEDLCGHPNYFDGTYSPHIWDRDGVIIDSLLNRQSSYTVRIVMACQYFCSIRNTWVSRFWADRFVRQDVYYKIAESYVQDQWWGVDQYGDRVQFYKKKILDFVDFNVTPYASAAMSYSGLTDRTGTKVLTNFTTTYPSITIPAGSPATLPPGTVIVHTYTVDPATFDITITQSYESVPGFPTNLEPSSTYQTHGGVVTQPVPYVHDESGNVSSDIYKNQTTTVRIIQNITVDNMGLASWFNKDNQLEYIWMKKRVENNYNLNGVATYDYSVQFSINTNPSWNNYHLTGDESATLTQTIVTKYEFYHSRLGKIYEEINNYSLGRTWTFAWENNGAYPPPYIKYDRAASFNTSNVGVNGAPSIKHADFEDDLYVIETPYIDYHYITSIAAGLLGENDPMPVFPVDHAERRWRKLTVFGNASGVFNGTEVVSTPITTFTWGGTTHDDSRLPIYNVGDHTALGPYTVSNNPYTPTATTLAVPIGRYGGKALAVSSKDSFVLNYKLDTPSMNGNGIIWLAKYYGKNGFQDITNIRQPENTWFTGDSYTIRDTVAFD